MGPWASTNESTRERVVSSWSVRTALVRHLDELDAMPADGLLQRRLERLRGYGVYKEG